MTYGMKAKVRVIQYGLGATGSIMARFMIERSYIQIMGAVDIVKEKVGKDLGEVLNLNSKVGVIITDDPDKLFRGGKPILYFMPPPPYYLRYGQK